MAAPTIRLQPRQQLLLGTLGGAIALALCVRFLFMPAIARIGERRATLQNLQVKTADAGVLMSQLPAFQATLQESQARYRLLERRVGESESVARVLETLSQQAKANELELVTVQPRAGESGKRLVVFGSELAVSEVPLTLQLTGRYHSLGEFLGALSDAPFLSSVRELTVSKPDAGHPELRADLTLAVYLHTTTQ